MPSLMFLNVMKCLLILSCIVLQGMSFKPDQEDEKNWFKACYEGEIDTIRELLEEDKEWAHHLTADGEHCLHVAGIQGQTEVTKFLLEHGADPNIRSTNSQGLRMHPLSWNVYGGHHKNIEILLDHKDIDVNADFDLRAGSTEKITALDLASQFLNAPNSDDGKKSDEVYELLVGRGAKKYEELENA